MTNPPQIPRGGVDLRKYAAIAVALAIARGELYKTLFEMQGAAEEHNVAERLNEIKRVLDITALSRVAEALGCSENDVAIDWGEHLTPSEVDRIKGW